MNRNERRGDLDIAFDEASGQIRSIRDCALGMDVIAFAPGAEVDINGHGLATHLVHVDDNLLDPAWQTVLESVSHPWVGCAQGVRLFRQVVVGSACKPWGNHHNRPNSCHIRYRLERMRVEAYDGMPHSAGQRPIQAPLWLDSIATLCGRTDWFGPETRMLQASIGGAGPIEHVGLDDALVAEVVPHMWNTYRRTHPGVQTIPGAAYHHPDGRWLVISCQRPSIGMLWDWGVDRCSPRFQYHDRLVAAEIVHTPEVSLYWGAGGRSELIACLASLFIAYEEPQPWFWRTTWFWLHHWQYRAGGFAEMAEQARFLHGELGITGFGLGVHDVRPGSWDCAPNGLRPSPLHGGETGLRTLTETIRGLGGRMFVWLPFLGMSRPSTDLKDDWLVRGEDGRPYESFAVGSFDMYNSVNFAHPGVQEYYLRWIRRWVGEFGVDGIFWDCGGTPQPPDFSPRAARPFQRFPSESMVAPFAFMERVMQEGRALSKDFFMWHECFGSDLPGTGYSTHTGNDRFASELSAAGSKRLVFRSSSTYNLYGGMPAVKPSSDCTFRSPVTLATYRTMAADPMNRWLVRFVREHGCREARFVDQGVAWCAGHLVVDPGKGDRQLVLPPDLGIRRLRHAITGTTAEIAADGRVVLPSDSAWEAQ